MPEWDIWFLLDFEDVKSAYQRADLFSAHVIIPSMPVGSIAMIPMMLDPPEHGKYRQPLAQWFGPVSIAAREQEIRQLAGELIDELVGRGSCEVLTDFTNIVPATIFLRMVGLDDAAIDGVLGRVRDGSMQEELPEGEDSTTVVSNFLVEHVGGLLAERRLEPKGDLASVLLAAEVDGRPLEDSELLAMFNLLYAAGLHTVAAELGFAFDLLAERPDLQTLLRERPEVIPGFVEEVLRTHGLATDCRLVTQDVDFAGCPMKAGDRVMLPTPLVGFDPEVFPDPLEFDPERQANRHLTFGAGAHRCVGSHLARLEMAIVLEEWHRRVPPYRLQPGAAERRRYQPGQVTGLLAVPLEWDVP
jgi:cytochrome P450